MAYLELENVIFQWPGQSRPVLDIPDLKVAAGERVFLRGASGSGKSTLLGLLAGIQAPKSGRITLGGVEVSALPSRQRDRFRAAHLGVVFQLFNLLPYLNVIENVCLPCHFSKERRERLVNQRHSMAEEARRLLRALDFHDEWMSRSVSQLSIGQQQRVAVARALIGHPGLILADEPTSALDADNRSRFLDLLFGEVAKAGSTLIFVSHDEALASRFDRHLELVEINRAVAAAGEVAQ